MAWFNNTESQGEENVVQPVSFQRLQSLVARNGWNVGTPEQVENPQFCTHISTACTQFFPPSTITA